MDKAMNIKLAEMIREASEALDPQRQGPQWPDPIEWDGRPLEEQGRDLCVALDAAAETAESRGEGRRADELRRLSSVLWSQCTA